MKTILILVTTLLLIGSLRAETKPAPSLIQTTKWMESFVADKSYWHIKDVTGSNNFASHLVIKGCQVTQSFYQNGLPDGDGDVTYSLSDLDPSSIKGYSGVANQADSFPFVDFGTTNSKEKIHLNGTGLTEWRINLDDPDAVPRFVKAFKHAVVLCGGKASVF